MNIDKTETAPPDAREIPPPPGGGSWAFDRATWEWISTYPAPVPANETPAAVVEFDGAAFQE